MGNTRIESYDKNIFYRDYFQKIILFLLIAIFSLVLIVSFLMYQLTHRPTPVFSTVSAKGKTMRLTPYLEPNLRSSVILTWASKAATLAYNFGFSDYAKKIQAVHPYFTNSGWQAYQAGIQAVINQIRKNQLIVQGVVSGTPVIANQGMLPGQGYTWRVEIPFLVTYLSSDKSQTSRYYVVMTIVKVPTIINPQGIGIDTFEMH